MTKKEKEDLLWLAEDMKDVVQNSDPQDDLRENMINAVNSLERIASKKER